MRQIASSHQLLSGMQRTTVFGVLIPPSVLVYVVRAIQCTITCPIVLDSQTYNGNKLTVIQCQFPPWDSHNLYIINDP